MAICTHIVLRKDCCKLCIIIAKGAGIPAPSLSTLRTCWDHNPDGAGLAIQQQGRVTILKGFLDPVDFFETLYDLGDLTPYAVIYHLRIATHGAISPGNTHPFPVSNRLEDLQATYLHTDLAVAHNGVIHGYGDVWDDLSDTMDYVQNQLHPLKALAPGFYRRPAAQDLIEYATESKWAFLGTKGKIVTIGHFEKVGGLLYSNRSFERKPVKTWKWRTYGCDLGTVGTLPAANNAGCR
jgi:predicted glutamine amidotransferase